MKLSEIRERTDEELDRLVHHTETELFKLRVQRHTSQLGNPMQLRDMKKQLARVLTILTARQQGREVAGAQPPAGAAPPKKPETVEEAMALAKGETPKAAAKPKATTAAKKAPAKKAKPAASAKAKKTTKSSKPAARGKTAKARTSRGGK